MEQIKDFLVMITTPGSEMPPSVQCVVIVLLAVLAVVLPKLFRWYYDHTRGPK